MKKAVYTVLLLLMIPVMSLAASGGGEDPVQADGDPTSVTAENFRLSWETEEEQIIFTFSAATTGWISVGFNPSRVMKDAQYVIGYVSGGTASVRDDFGTGTFSHGPDTDLGGTDDVQLVSAREADGWTEIVFALPIDSGDAYDTVLTPGETHTVLIAYGPDDRDDFTTKHRFKTSFEAVL
jgi:hypothetical protein